MTGAEGNLFAAIPPAGEAEQILPLAAGAHARIERIVSQGHAGPPGEWYDQEWPEWVALLQGAAVLEFADGTHRRLAPGDHLTLPAHLRHRVAWTSSVPPAIWLAVHFRP